MPFDPNVIPPTNRTPAAMAVHVDMWKRSLDTWKIYNPTDTDYVLHFDKFGSNERWVAPASNKDIGHGKGMQHVPQYIMVRYHQKMGVELINKKIKEDWNTKKMEFRLEDRGKMEEGLALRSNDPALWDEITPILIKGIVSRYGGDEIEEEVEAPKPENRYASPAESSLERLGMTDIDVGVEADTLKDDFINQVS